MDYISVQRLNAPFISKKLLQRHILSRIRNENFAKYKTTGQYIGKYLTLFFLKAPEKVFTLALCPDLYHFKYNMDVIKQEP